MATLTELGGRGELLDGDTVVRKNTDSMTVHAVDIENSTDAGEKTLCGLTIYRGYKYGTQTPETEVSCENCKAAL